MSEMVERVVAAINNTAIVRDMAGDQMGVLGKEPFFVVVNPEQVARAAIAAMRSPTEGMLDAHLAAFGTLPVNPGAVEHHKRKGRKRWQAMIDKALEE